MGRQRGQDSFLALVESESLAPMPAAPRYFDDVADCVEATLKRLGNRIVLALPLGIGKPNPLANEFYRRARQDSRIELKIFPALSLSPPRWRNELERRFLQPLV